ncbi:MAG TPA: polyphosphate:AMP phosphotransferase [Methanomassiliicoccales archaeon]
MEEVDLGKKLDDKEFSKQMERLTPEIGEMQRLARYAKKPIVVVFEGWDTNCMSKVINDYIRCLDPRGFDLYPIGNPTEEESARPFMWRFFIKTPEKGRIAIFDRSWYSRTLEERVPEKKEDKVPPRALEEINDFERQLAADHCTMIKFFLQMSKKEHHKRLEKAEKGNGRRCLLVQDGLVHHKEYEKYLPMVEDVLERTDRPNASWTIIEAEDDNYALVRVIEASIATIKATLEKKNGNGWAPMPDETRYPFGTTTLKNLDLSVSIDPTEYKEQLNKMQQKLGDLQCRIFKQKIPLIIALEGWDAAGKGGDILRLTDNLDPRGYRVVPISAPNDLELSHHYLWRFYSKFPEAGHVAIFDRTWYGRVLVERVENITQPSDWRRAYTEINETEEMLADGGSVLVKMWLQIDKVTQLKRFQERESDEMKKWKITPDDWRNREKWDQYELAVEEMLMRTSTRKAPWTVVESNDKYYSRIKVLRTVIEAVEKRLD